MAHTVPLALRNKSSYPTVLMHMALVNSTRNPTWFSDMGAAPKNDTFFFEPLLVGADILFSVDIYVFTQRQSRSLP